jgi:hypothetical protein
MTYEEELKQIAEVICNPDYVTYCSLDTRPGVRAWMTEIEYTKFRPGTLDNDDFHLGILKWPDGPWGMRYLIICFHRSVQEFAESILWKNGLRKTEEGTFPIMMGGPEGIQKFPLADYNNVFFLENHSKGAENVIYSNDPVKIKAARELEDKQCQVFFDSQMKWLASPEGIAALAEYLKKHPDGQNI